MTVVIVVGELKRGIFFLVGGVNSTITIFEKSLTYDVADEARGKGEGVLVHCLAGISRSVTVTVAYLMQTLHKSLDEAYDLVRAQKSNIAPNFNFMGQLLDFERQLRASSGSPDSGQFSYDDAAEAAGRATASHVADGDQMHFLSPTTAVNLRKTTAGVDPPIF